MINEQRSFALNRQVDVESFAEFQAQPILDTL
jgi:hypothetical protein